MLRRIYFYGALADNFGGQPLELSAGSAPDLLLAFRSIFKDWRAYVSEHPEMAFVVSGDNSSNPRAIEAAFIESQFGDATEVHIVPAQDGAFAAIPAIIAAIGTQATISAIIVKVLISMAISAALSAVMQALAPSPQTGSGSSNQIKQNQSFIFDGAVNVNQQGGPVPIIYGYFMSGSTVVSASIDVEQLLITPTQAEAPSNGEGSTQPTSPPVTSWQWAGI